MKNIFPIEIAAYTNETYWVKRNVTSKIIYLSIISILLILFSLLPFIKIDVSSQSRGTIRSVYENNTLQPVISAEIKKVNISENLSVLKGDTLVWLKTDIIDEQINRLKEKTQENDLFIADIEALLRSNIKDIKSAKYLSEYAHSVSKLNEQQISLAQSENEYQVTKKLYEKGVESRFEYDQSQKKHLISQSQLLSTKRNFINSWQSEKTRLELENKDLKSQLIRLEKDKTQYYIIAPIGGNIIQYTGVKEGNFLISGQSIAQIASTSDLLVECYVSPSDIGYITEEQPVNIQMDAFDYRQWGLLEGKVIEIVTDITNIDNQPFFRVRCSIDKNYIELKNGHRGSLKKGMTLTGRFILAERSLAQLLFDKVDNWMNPKIINNGSKD